MGMLVARATAWAARVTVDVLDFRAKELRDEDGVNIHLRIFYHDLTETQKWAASDTDFREFINASFFKDQQSRFLCKAIAASPLGRTTLQHTLLLIQVCVAKTTEDDGKLASRLLFLERRPWGEAINRYATKYGLAIKFVSPTKSIRSVILPKLSRNLRSILRSLRYGRYKDIVSIFSTWMTLSGEHTEEVHSTEKSPGGAEEQDRRPKVATEHYGQLNLGDPALHSDLFFWQESRLWGDDVILTFGSPSAMLDATKLETMKQHGIGAIVHHPGATSIPGYYQSWSHKRAVRKSINSKETMAKGLASQWLRKQIRDYDELHNHWAGIFAGNNVKVFLSWFKNDTSHIAVADAIRSQGGIAAIYQRSTEFHPSALTTTDADVIFTFSRMGTDAFRLSESSARYYVTTGYLGDHRFELLRGRSESLRERLMGNGAEKILALFDESYREDSRWEWGFEQVRNDYGHLLQKVIDHSWFGMVIKPKNPAGIRRWLGPVADLLSRAEATGRCYIFEGTDGIQGAYPPAAAALSADVAVHNHMWPGTAGMEAALANVPTLLLDSSSWPESPFYRLGGGKVVFTSMPDLWEACAEQWSSTGPIAGFGDWSPMLDELDPFRDGRAAERMGGYVSTLLEGFRDGLDRDTVMENAAERYATQWGSDKIIEAKAGSLVSQI